MKKNIVENKNGFLYSNKLLSNFCNWFLSNSVGLITIPLTFLILLHTLYPAIFQKEFSDGFKWYKLEDYYKFFDKNKKNDIFPSNVEIQKDTTKYCHILVIDRTLSVINANGSDIDSFSDYLEEQVFKNSISNKTPTFDKNIVEVANQSAIKKAKDKKIPIMHVLTLGILQKLIDDTNSNGIITAFFDGDEVNVFDWKNEIKNKTMNFQPEYYRLKDKESREKYIGDLSKKPLMSTDNKISDFVKLFNEINTLCEKSTVDSASIILTIVSDYDHEIYLNNKIVSVEIDDDVIEKFKQSNKNKITQYNIVYCPPNNSERKIASDKLVKKIIDQIEGLDHFVNINLDEVSKFNDDLKKRFENKLSGCLSPINIHEKEKEKIHFYYPSEGHNVRTALAKIKIPQNVHPFEWRIVTMFPREKDDDFFVSYAFNENKLSDRIKCAVNGRWYHKEANDNILYLNIGLSNLIDIERYKFEIKYGNDSFKRYHIALHELIPPYFAIFGLSIMNIFCVCIIIILISYCFILCHYIFKAQDTKIKNYDGNICHKISFIFFETLMAIAIPVFLIYKVLWGWGYGFLIVTNFTAILCVLWILIIKGKVVYMCIKSTKKQKQ